MRHEAARRLGTHAILPKRRLAPSLAAVVLLAVLTSACSHRPGPRAAVPSRLVWLDREGKPDSTLGGIHIDIRDPEISPDGSPVTFAAGANGDELWMIDLASGA